MRLENNTTIRMSNGLCDLLTNLATRCNVNSEKVLRKSKELIGLLNSKQQLGCSDTCKVVICLELASSLSSSPISREQAIKYSGYKKRNYTNFYNNISKILNLDKIYSVSEICLLVGVSDVQQPVNKLLQKFKSNSQENDFEHPMYACAALLAVCRANKIKINQTKLVEIGRIKKLELEELCKKFTAVLETYNKKNEKNKRRNNLTQTKTVEMKGNEETPSKKKSTSGVMSDKEYEEWKKKMLEE